MAVFAEQRAGSAAVFAPQFASAAPAPTGAITSIVVSGQTVTVSGTTANAPTSGLATLPAATTPNGAVSQGPSAVTLASGTFTITFTAVPPGNYATPVVTLTNASGTATASGGAAFEVLGVDGEPEAPGPAVFTPVGIPVAVNVGSAVWTYAAPPVLEYVFVPTGLTVQVQVGSATFTYTPPPAPEYDFAPAGFPVSVEIGSVAWAFTPPAQTGEYLVTLAEARAHIRSDDSDDDADLNLKIAAASMAVVDYLGSYAEPFADGDGRVLPGKTVPSRVRMATLLMVGHLYREREGGREQPVPQQYGYGYSLPIGATALLYSLRKPVVA